MGETEAIAKAVAEKFAAGKATREAKKAANKTKAAASSPAASQEEKAAEPEAAAPAPEPSAGSAVTPKTIKQLRDAAGAGMMDCKKALLECDGDQEVAADFLRKKGLAKAGKKASRVA